MYSKRKYYKQVAFPLEIFEEAISEFKKILTQLDKPIESTSLRYSLTNEEITIIDPEQHDLFKGFNTRNFQFRLNSIVHSTSIYFYQAYNILSVELSGLQNEAQTERIFVIFDKTQAMYKLPTEDTLKQITVFLGHGRNIIWKSLKDHLHEQHGIKVSAYETGARAGYTIQEVLDECSNEASIAFLVHTGEDIDRDGQAHARENVVHETGLFQGKLGFKRAIVLLENGCNEFSNIAGLQQIRFAKDNIKEVFGDVLAVLRREFSKE